jgi:ABC-type antimicrobial peptide transport system permease subunit
VVPDIRQGNLGNESDDPVIYVPHRFESSGSMQVLLRTSTEPTSLATALRTEVQQLDQDLALFDVRTLDDQIARGRWYLRVFGTVFLIFALIALCMAAVGIYAVMAQATNRRTREIGVRIALGAGVSSILRLVLGRGIKQLALGVVLGLAAGLAVCRLMARLMFHVSPSDPLTFIAVTATLLAAGLFATWLPARRAAKLDPVKALRYE